MNGSIKQEGGLYLALPSAKPMIAIHEKIASLYMLVDVDGVKTHLYVNLTMEDLHTLATKAGYIKKGQESSLEYKIESNYESEVIPQLKAFQEKMEDLTKMLSEVRVEVKLISNFERLPAE
jgi:hypothetical protein